MYQVYLGDCLLRQGRMDEAEPLLRESLDGLGRSLRNPGRH